MNNPWAVHQLSIKCNLGVAIFLHLLGEKYGGEARSVCWIITVF